MGRRRPHATCADVSSNCVRLPEETVAGAGVRLVPFEMRQYVSSSDGDGGGGGGGGKRGGGLGGGNSFEWCVVDFFPAICLGPYPLHSVVVQELVAWTRHVGDLAGHHKLTDALTAHDHAGCAELLPPDP